MNEKLQRLRKMLGEVMDLQYAAAVLGWDQQTYMPPGGTEGRAMQLATLGRLAHEMFTNDEVGALLESLKPEFEGDTESDDACLVRQTARDYEKQRKVPNEFVAEFDRVTTLAHKSWDEARKKSDFAHFQPELERIVELRQTYANFFSPYDHIYDPLLDDFEPGMKTAEVKKVFEDLRPQQVKLVEAIAASPHQIDDSILHQEFDEKKQWDFGEEVVRDFGYDFTRGRQDLSVHPFTTSFGIDDVRITTRAAKNYFNTAIFGTMHEAGHGIYEQGISKTLARTPLADGASLGLHESQSRMWENLVGRSLPFWKAYFPRLQDYFPSQLGETKLEDFYRAINMVERSLIRVEADEATYNLHIMLRFELETGVMDGSLAVGDLPEVWDNKMEEYLGIRPPTDAEGVLQDIHWSFGGFGYFSTYSLGNLIAGMLWEKIHEDIPDLEGQISNGNFGDLLAWLRENIHVHGAKFDPLDLLRRVTGSGLDAAPYMRYLQEKFGELYQL